MEPLIKTASWRQGWYTLSPFSPPVNASLLSAKPRQESEEVSLPRQQLSEKGQERIPEGQTDADNTHIRLPDELLKAPTCKTETVMNRSPDRLFFIVLGNILHCQGKCVIIYSLPTMTLRHWSSVVSSLLGTWPFGRKSSPIYEKQGWSLQMYNF